MDAFDDEPVGLELLGTLELADRVLLGDGADALDLIGLDAVDQPEDDEPVLVEDGEVDLTTREISMDALQLFLKDIGRVRLLTAAQEVDLARRIERGDQRAKAHMIEANLAIRN